MDEELEHKIDILNILEERDFNRDTCCEDYIKAVLEGAELALKQIRVEIEGRDILTKLNKTLSDELEKYKLLYSQALARGLNENISSKNKADNDLKLLNEGWKIECEKKDKIINLILQDLIACGGLEFINIGISNGNYDKDKQKLKQYYERKVTNEEI